MKRSILLSLATMAIPTAGNISILSSQEKPNILWLTIEDTSWFEFGTYGHPQAKTPNLDYLASNGIKFSHAWSCGPQSSPARSTIITGCYSSTYGMEWHRQRVKTPENIFFPQLLRDAGYYCTNNAKTDYNSTNDNKACWDECSNDASYLSPERKKNQPFFAVFNSGVTHMSRLTSYHLDGRRDFAKEGLDPKKLILPEHLPDIPEVRSDYAFHLEGVTDIDKQVGLFIKDLKKRGLWENTIIFFYSDHGGCSPRGKGYLYESGVRVPMIVYVPEKYRKELGIKAGTTSNRLVSFVDLAPTVLSLAEAKIPSHYQGHAFLGKQKTPDNKMQYAICCNQATHFQPIRAASDGRYKYIRRYIPYKQHALRNYFQWAMPGNMGWDNAYQKNQCMNNACSLPFTDQYTEELFDQSTDSVDVHNLAGNPKYQKILLAMRDSVKQFNRRTKDLGFFMLETRISKDVYTLVRTTGFPLNELYDLIDMTLDPKADTKKIVSYLNHAEPEFRYWAIVNLAQLGKTKRLKECPSQLKKLLEDPNPYIAAEAAYALCVLGESDKGMEFLLADMNTQKVSILETLALDREINRIFTPERIAFLKTKTDVKKYANQKDLGVMVRGVLVNLNEWSAYEIYPSKECYAEGLKVNETRRPIKGPEIKEKQTKNPGKNTDKKKNREDEE